MRYLRIFRSLDGDENENEGYNRDEVNSSKTGLELDNWPKVEKPITQNLEANKLSGLLHIVLKPGFVIA